MRTARYEDFLDDPARIVREVCDFVELDFTPDQVPAEGHRAPEGSVEPEKWYPLKRGENARYLKDLDPDLPVPEAMRNRKPVISSRRVSRSCRCFRSLPSTTCTGTTTARSRGCRC